MGGGRSDVWRSRERAHNKLIISSERARFLDRHSWPDLADGNNDGLLRTIASRIRTEEKTTRIPREKTFCLKQVCFRKYLALCHNILPLRSPHFHPNLQNQDASPRISLPFPGIIGRQTNSSVLQAQIRDDFSSGYSAHRWNTSL